MSFITRIEVKHIKQTPLTFDWTFQDSDNCTKTLTICKLSAHLTIKSLAEFCLTSFDMLVWLKSVVGARPI